MDNHSISGKKFWQSLCAKIFFPTFKITNRSQLLSLIRDAYNSKIIDNEALAIVEGAIQVADLQVRDIMIPRANMVSIKIDADISKFLPEIIESAHSRFPVIAENNDEVLGILLAKDLLPLILQPVKWNTEKIHNIMRQAVFVPESKRLNVLLREFRANHNHMAIVVDEYGAAAGIVTIEDVLEQIVGDIEDEHDVTQESQIKILPCGDLVVKTTTPLKCLSDELKCELVIVQEQNNLNNLNHKFTVADWLLQLFAELPQRGEIAYFENLKIRVLSADSMRVHLIRISKNRML